MWVAALCAAAHSRDLFCCVNLVRSSPLSEEELCELPECVLCERLVRRAERGVRSGARVPSLRGLQDR
jgi:hypothetical protein